jgi:hypothetical protein
MVEATGLVSNLQKEKDWNFSCIFTDTEKIIATNKCNVLPDEIK